jgi:glucose-6-phosphate dehydrogenase assembly protein OpcA
VARDLSAMAREASWLEGVWTEQDTTPSEIEAHLREMLMLQHAKTDACMAARVLNLVVILDREWRGEIYNRLEQVGRYHPSRTIFCTVEPGRSTIDVWASMSTDHDPKSGEIALTRERIVLDLGPGHLKALDTIVKPLVVSDIATVVWSPHGHHEAVEALLDLAQVVLLDSIMEPDSGAAVARAEQFAERAYVVDLAWLRSTPWRERIAASFDPRGWREELRKISAVTVRHRPDSTIAGLLFLGWLAARLEWQPGPLTAANGSLFGKAHGRRQDVDLRLEPDPGMSAPGLSGVTVETASGMAVSLDRGPGGLTAKKRMRDGREPAWTVLGASRGEGGILGEGIRQALLRDPTYRAAIERADAMLG